MTHFKTLLLTLTSVSIAQSAFAQNATPFQAQKMAHDLMRLNSGLLHGQQQKYPDVFSRIGSRFEMPEVNAELVRKHEQQFTRQAAYLNRTIKRSEPYLHHVATEVERRNMPGEIALLPFIESAFVIKAKSPVGASGLWQFMPATGKDFNLDQTHVYDGRHDVYASTDAALNYLEYLYGLFGDWSLALAAYNWGQGNVTRAIKRAEAQGLLPTYENLRMPQETRNYAPKLLAWRNIVHNPAAFGLQLPHIGDQAYFQAVDVTTPIDTATAAKLADISHEEFLRLNPGFNLPVFIPSASRKMLLPKDSVARFVKNYQSSKADDLSTYHVYTPMRAEKAEEVAASFGMTESELHQINGLRRTNLSAGLPVLVAKNRAPIVLSSPATEDGVNLVDASSFVQTTVRQADRLNQPLAQLSAPTALKVRAVRATPNVSYQFAQNTAAQNPVTVTSVPMAIKETDIAIQAKPVSVAAKPILTAAAPIITADKAVPVVQTALASTIDASATATTAANVPDQALQAAAPTTKAQNATPLIAVADQATPSVNLLASAQTSTAQQVVQADPLLNLMNHRPNISSTDQSAAVSMARNDHVANSVRDTIARENAREAREQERLAKVQAQNEKRERQLANANEHKVASGETLYSIARTYDMNVSELLAANALNGHHIEVGQTLKVGKAADKAIQVAQAKQTTKAKAQTAKNTNYVVRKGDTLVSIAGKFNVKVNDLKKWNNTDSNLKPGQKLQLRQL